MSDVGRAIELASIGNDWEHPAFHWTLAKVDVDSSAILVRDTFRETSAWHHDGIVRDSEVFSAHVMSVQSLFPLHHTPYENKSVEEG